MKRCPSEYNGYTCLLKQHASNSISSTMSLTISGPFQTWLYRRLKRNARFRVWSEAFRVQPERCFYTSSTRKPSFRVWSKSFRVGPESSFWTSLWRNQWFRVLAPLGDYNILISVTRNPKRLPNTRPSKQRVHETLYRGPCVKRGVTYRPSLALTLSCICMGS